MQDDKILSKIRHFWGGGGRGDHHVQYPKKSHFPAQQCVLVYQGHNIRYDFAGSCFTHLIADSATFGPTAAVITPRDSTVDLMRR